MSSIVVLLLSTVLITACGDPSTQVFVVNRDAVPHYLTLRQGSGPGDRSDVFVPGGGQGLLLSTAGESSGVVQLRRTDCTVAAEVTIFPGHANLITITGGALEISGNADLSTLVGGDLGPASDCLGA
jgi:hypothetical protein